MHAPPPKNIHTSLNYLLWACFAVKAMIDFLNHHVGVKTYFDSNVAHFQQISYVSEQHLPCREGATFPLLGN